MNLKFDTGNAAFDGDNEAHEIARILRLLAEKVEAGATEGYVYDINGNRVGEWWL